MVSSSSTTEPGEPCVMINGSAFSRASQLRQSYSEAQSGEFLYRCRLHTLGPIRDQFPRRPARRIDAAMQLFDLLLRNVDEERPDRSVRTRNRRGVTHDPVLRSAFAPALS